MEDAPWHIRRRRELQAAAPVRRSKAERFVIVPLWWVEAAAKAARSPATLVLIELLHIAWKNGSITFPLPSERLRRRGVSRDVKRRVLRNLEHRGLILVERSQRKAPIVTLVGF
jgi:hypothetical protein